MASVIYCENCDAQQPNDWKSGDLCGQCGGAVREELRCAWCAKTTPKGKFCKHCGNEVQEDKNFGPARILKSLGVDQLQLTQKLSELQSIKLEQYRNQYNQHYAFVELARQDLRRIEEMLVIRGQEKFTALDDELIPNIPFAEAYLEKCQAYAKQDAPQHNADFLAKRHHFHSEVNRTFAELAYYRLYPFPEDLDWEQAALTIKNSIASPNILYSQEALLFFSHINSFLAPIPWEVMQEAAQELTIGEKTFIEHCLDTTDKLLERSYLRPYVAVAITHLLQACDFKAEPKYNRYGQLAKEALDHQDAYLRLAAGLLFEEGEVIKKIARRDDELTAPAIEWLIANKPELLPDIITNKRLTERQLNVLEEESDKHTFFLPPQLDKPYEQLATYALTPLLEPDGFRQTDTQNKEGQPLYYRLIAFAGKHGSVSQQELDMLVLHSQTSQKQDAAEAILSHVSQTDLDLSHVIDLWYDQPSQLLDYQSGFDFINKALPMLKAGNYPSEKALLKLLAFCKLHFRRMSLSNDGNRGIALEFFDELAFAFHPVSYTFSKFWMRELFDIVNYMVAEWLLMITVDRAYLRRKYIVDGDEQARNFELTDTFIQDFFEGSWDKFIAHYKHVIAFNSFTKPECHFSHLIEHWMEPVKEDFAQRLLDEPQYARDLLEAQKDALILGYDGILNIQNSEGEFPFIKALGAKSRWDTGDVILYSLRHQDVHYIQPEDCLSLFHEWLLRDNCRNYYSPVFNDRANSFFTFSSNSKQLPFGMIITWLKMSAASSAELDKVKFFNDRFTCLNAYAADEPMMKVLKNGEEFKLTGQSVIEGVFSGFAEFYEYIIQNFNFGLNHPTNIFVLHALQDVGKDIVNYIDEDTDEKALLHALFYLAMHRENSDYTKEFWLKGVLNVMLNLAPVAEDKGDLISMVWKMADLHFSITERVYEFIKQQAADILANDQVRGIKFLYAYVEDYYYGQHGAPWVGEVMEESVKDIAKGFASDEELMNEKINHLLSFSNKKPYDNEQSRIQKQFEKHIINVLDHMELNEVSDNLWMDLEYKIHQDEINFFFKTDLERWMEEHGVIKEDEEEETTADYIDEDVEPVNTPIPEDMDFDPEEIHMDLMEMSTFMSSFVANPENMLKLIDHIPYYKKDKSDNPMILSVLMMKGEEIKAILAEDMGIAINLYQKLLEVVIDPLCAPDGPFPSYGSMASLQMQQLLQGSMFAMQYISSVEAMLSAGIYTPAHQAMLQNLLDQLKDAS